MMYDRINRLLERAANSLAKRPGAPIMVGIGLVATNFLLQLFPGNEHWFVASNVLLHLGLIISLVGVLLIRPLG
jgi:hypothetical protein